MSTANISQTVTNKASIAIANKYKVAYGFSIGVFIFVLGPWLGLKVKVMQHLVSQNFAN